MGRGCLKLNTSVFSRDMHAACMLMNRWMCLYNYIYTHYMLCYFSLGYMMLHDVMLSYTMFCRVIFLRCIILPYILYLKYHTTIYHTMIYIYIYIHILGQIIATSHDLTPNGGFVREIFYFREI